MCFCFFVVAGVFFNPGPPAIGVYSTVVSSGKSKTMVKNRVDFSWCYLVASPAGAGLITEGTCATIRLLLSRTGLRTLGPVFGAALCAVFNTGCVKCAAHDVVANTGKVLHTAAAHQHD